HLLERGSKRRGNHGRVVIAGQQIDIQVAQTIGHVAAFREGGFELLGFLLGIDALDQAQHRPNLAKANPIVVQKLGINIVDDAGLVLPGDAENLVDNTARGFPGRQLRRQVESRSQCISPRRGSLLAQKQRKWTFPDLRSPESAENICGPLGVRLIPSQRLKVAERKEWLRSFAYGEEAGKNKSKDCFLRFVEQFNGLFANGKARDPNQAPDAKQILQLLAEPSLGELPLKAWHAFRRHWHDLSDMADPVMIPLAQSQLAVGLKEQPVCKP